MTGARTEWYEEFFEHDWLDEIALTIGEERTARDVDFVRADARELAFEAEFDAAVNLFTSVIGYFDDESEDRRVIGGVARTLRPGGSFLIDTINLLALPRGFAELGWDQFESGTIMLE